MNWLNEKMRDKQATRRAMLDKKLNPKPRLRGERGKLDKVAEKQLFNNKVSK